MGSIVECGIGWCRRGSHGSTIELLEGAVSKSENVVAHDEMKCVFDCIQGVVRVPVLHVLAKQTGNCRYIDTASAVTSLAFGGMVRLATISCKVKLSLK